MHIHSFYVKLKSNDGGPLFEALRSLSLVEDPKAMFNADGGVTALGEWIPWPPMDAHASGADSSLV